MHLSKRSIGLGLMTSTLLATSPALAETALPDGASPQATTVGDVIVTASATGVDVRDAPASVSVITRDEIERQPVQSLGELLGRLPGVTGGVSPTGALSKINIRGLPDNYTLMLVDGRRIGNARDISYRPDLGRQDLNWISPDMIERIEVVRGPMSSLYGSDAMGGVINIITRKIAPTWRGSANTSYTWSEDSDRGDAYQFGVNAAGPITDTLGLRLGATYARTNPDEVIISGNNGTGGVTSKNLNGVLTWAPVAEHAFSLEGSYGLEDPIAPSLKTTTGNAQSSWGAETQRTSYRLGHEGKWSFGESRIDIYKNAFSNKDQSASGGTAEFEELIIDGLWKFEKNFIWDHKFAVGAQYREEELTNTSTIGLSPIDYEGNPVEGATLNGDSAALFAEDQITLRENLLLTLGGRLDSHHKYGEHFSPRAYLVWHPAEVWTIRGGISQGFRAPSLKENSAGAATDSRGNGCGGLNGMTAKDKDGNVVLDANGEPVKFPGGGCWMAGNPELTPEESTSYEIGFSYDSDNYRFGATYFYTDFKNKIQYAPLGGLKVDDKIYWWTKNENIEKARTQGLEVTGLAKLPYDLTLRGNATWMIEAKNLETGANLITTPEWSAYASLDWRATERLGIMLSGQYTGEQLGGGSTITNSHTEFDLTAAFDASESVTLRAGITNLFSETITGSSGDGYYAPGRRFFVGLTTRF